MQTSCLSLSRRQRTLSFCQCAIQAPYTLFLHLRSILAARRDTNPICGVGKVSVCVAAERIYTFALVCGKSTGFSRK
jgi:hypothetical protein